MNRLGRRPSTKYRADHAGIFNQVAERGTSRQVRSSGCARVPAHLASQRPGSIPGSHAVATLVLATIRTRNTRVEDPHSSPTPQGDVNVICDHGLKVKLLACA